MSHLLQARDIALRSVHAGVTRFEGKSWVLAGGDHYRCLWTRDLAMSVMGVLHAGEAPAVRESIATLFKLRDHQGRVPRAADVGSVPMRVMLASVGYHRKFRPPLKGSFRTENGVHSIDGNLILPWAASRYVLHTRDFEFAKEYFSAAQECLARVQRTHLVGGLIGGQPPFSDWADSLRREGVVAWTNQIYWLALGGLAEWAFAMGLRAQGELYRDLARDTAQQIVECFWDERLGALRSFVGDGHLAADVNLLAITTHLLDPQRARRALNTLRGSPLWRPIPGAVAYPDYGPEKKSWIVKVTGLSGYHDSMIWLWISSLAVRAHLALGDLEESVELLQRIARLICDHHLISEVYEALHDRKSGKDGDALVPVRRWLYRSETPFTWSAAMFLEAIEAVKKTPGSSALPGVGL